MQNIKREQFVQQFAIEWEKKNPAAFESFMSQTHNVFTEEDRQEHGSDLLADVLAELQKKKTMALQGMIYNP